MKRVIIALTMTLGICLIQVPAKADPITTIIVGAVKKVLKAMDLAVQRLQNATIKLQNIQKALENAMAKLKLNEIFEWSEKQRALFASYYDELWKVKTTIMFYQRTKDIVSQQIQIVEEYKRTIGLFNQDKHFTEKELRFIADVYLGILEESIKSVDQISIVVTAFSTQMSDAKRLEIIHRTAEAVQKNLNDLRRFTNQNVMLSLQRSRDANELSAIKRLYGIAQ